MRKKTHLYPRTIRFDTDTFLKLHKLAKADRRNFTDYIRLVLQDHIADRERQTQT